MSETHSGAAETAPQIRYESCLAFEQTGIPHVVWFEKALRRHGVPTVALDLYILVLDIEVAANALVESGWVLDTVSPRQIGGTVVEISQNPLITPDNRTRTVLLLASGWRFPLATNLLLEHVPMSDKLLSANLSFPTSSALLDALIKSYRAGPTVHQKLLLHPSCYYNYLYEYVPAVTEPSFAD
ncbi:hypothetical protein ASPCAL13588 [Aspergillus calidoustus]|uniref:Uncharacterized protein n=1 Tax=Aspergillus calidoustus TaxID=454130 RepID=A0A0U4ZLK1_ASPCI|nr:hypothetical protein ASPCAL13588 [Aspergillus calidoustus]